MSGKFTFTKEQILEQLEAGKAKAAELLADEGKLERFLQQLEDKFASVPNVGEELSKIPLFASMVRAYAMKEYRDVPMGSILAMLSALIYFVSPIDLIPDFIPVLGYMDDAAVMVACWALVSTDVEDYRKWREERVTYTVDDY